MDLRCTWLGRLAKPTKPESFFYLSRNKGFWSNSFQKFKKKEKEKEVTYNFTGHADSDKGLII